MHRMQAVAMTLACLGMLGTVHAQDTPKEDLAGVYDATVARTASDSALGTVSATFNVTGSSNVRGIWGKSGTLSIDAIAGDAEFNVSSTRNNAFGIDTSSGVNLDIGTLAGTFNISAANTNATGIRSYGKILSIGTITENALISITANFSSNGIYAYQGRLDIGTMAGKISVALGTGNYARGLYAYGNTMDYQGPRYKDVSIGTFSSTGSISAATTGGYGARGIQSNYGQVNITRLDGQITATSGSNDESEDFSAIGIEARENITLGDMGATGSITATTNGHGCLRPLRRRGRGLPDPFQYHHRQCGRRHPGGSHDRSGCRSTFHRLPVRGRHQRLHLRLLHGSCGSLRPAGGILPGHRRHQRNRQRGNFRQHGGGPNGRSRHHDDHRFHRRP